MRAGPIVAAISVAAACSSCKPSHSSAPAPVVLTLHDEITGNYDLGPIAFHGSTDNTCAPYTPDLETAAGEMLAGVSATYNGDGQLCDACILILTGAGKTVIARVITAGATDAPGDVD